MRTRPTRFRKSHGPIQSIAHQYSAGYTNASPKPSPTCDQESITMSPKRYPQVVKGLSGKSSDRHLHIVQQFSKRSPELALCMQSTSRVCENWHGWAITGLLCVLPLPPRSPPARRPSTPSSTSPARPAMPRPAVLPDLP